jgi:hypothetical protein
MRPYLITAKLMRPSNMKRFPTPGLGYSLFQLTHSTFSMFFLGLDVLWVYISEFVLLYFHLPSCLNDLSIFVYSSLFDAVLN